MRCALLLVCLLIPPATAFSQEVKISTVAGTGEAANNGNSGAADKINIGQPFGVELGPDGALYVTEVEHHRVRRLDLKTKEVSTVAGNGQRGYSGDGGPAIEAKLDQPYEVRFDKDGNMFFVEMVNNVVRRVDAKTKVISTVAGVGGRRGYGGDGGPAVQALFSAPHSIALDGKGGLYIADINNNRIRRVDLASGIVDSIAGSNGRTLPKDGQIAKGNSILAPRALYIDGDVMWIALREGHSVWKMSLTDGILHHVSGTGTVGYTGDGGPAKDATYNGPKGIVVGPDKNVYVVDTENHCIRKIDVATGVISTLAGSGPDQAGAAGDGGLAVKGQMNRPHGICIGPDGAVYIGDTVSHKVRMVK